MNISNKLIKRHTHSDIYEYTLSNKRDLCCSISNYGATILSISLLDSKNQLRNLALGFKDFTTYLNNSLYAGATLGPNAGRLGNALLSINNKVYTLSKNDKKNNLHGGFNNASFKLWTYEDSEILDSSVSVTFSLTLPHTLDGFPGNRILLATFTLTDDNELKLHYESTSDMDTYINISNHCYFNLSGDFNSSALEQKLTISASKYLSNNENHIPTELSSVDDSPFDFINSKTIKKQIEAYANHPQISLCKGYNNSFYLENTKNMDKPAAILESPNGDVSLSLYTDAPSLVFYSGGYIEEGLLLKDNSLSTPSCGIALEAQDFPNGPNLDFINSKYLKKYETFTRDIIYKFQF